MLQSLIHTDVAYSFIRVLLSHMSKQKIQKFATTFDLSLGLHFDFLHTVNTPSSAYYWTFIGY